MTPKQLSNPFSTGSGGAFFESRVQAAFASLMLSKGVCPCLPSWPIYKVKLQGKYSGYATDDVIVFVRDERLNREAKLIAQIKHAPAITKLDPQFTEVMQSAWTDFNNPTVFEYGYDALALITGPLTATDTYDVRDMLEIARTSQDSTDFFNKIKLANFSSKGKQDKLEVFTYHLTNLNKGVAPDDETTWKFLRSFYLLGYDLDIRAGASISLLHSVIGAASPDDSEKVWLKILNETQSWNPRAGVLTLQSLPKELLDHFRVIIPPQLPIVPVTPIRETIAAALIGAWDENSPGDRNSIEAFTGMSFAQWQDKIRDVWLNCPGLFDQKDGRWRVVDRLAFWTQEGPRVSDSLLDQLQGLAIGVLGEEDPALELAPEQRFAANVHGKSRVHSGLIRKGVAETLALLGAEGSSLSTCSFGKARAIADISVRDILAGEKWSIWASANDILPLLAEASPDSFLQAVQDAANSTAGVFADVFRQEGPAIMGRSYVTGVLWGLESLAWKSDYLVPVCRILADLAAIDPGGNWSNRPSNSLTTILLPWLPQTSASTEKRHASANVVRKRHDAVGWELICSLLPKPNQMSLGAHKPIWQKFITVDYKDGVPQSQYWEDVLFYSDLALEMAGNNVERLAALVDGYFKLPVEIRQKLRDRISSEGIRLLTEDLRLRLWQSLNHLTTNHRRFADSDNWKVPEGTLEELDALADQLRPTAPEVKHKRLFSGDDFDLYEDTDNYEEQEAKLAIRRQDAVREIYTAGGKDLLTTFVKAVGEPWRVGSALSSLRTPEIDGWIIPAFLTSDEKSFVQFAGGYVWGCYRVAGWQWVDSLTLAGWTNAQLGQFFTFLPFCEETWKRVASHMSGDEANYWQKASANPYEAVGGLEEALKKLVLHDRPDVALRTMQMMLHKEKTLPVDVAIQALQAIGTSHRLDSYAIGKVLSFLQKNASEREPEIRDIEWKFMPLLGRYSNAEPVFLSRGLSDDPEFFCKIIQTIYRSKKAEGEAQEPSEDTKAKAQLAYRLLNEWKLPPGTLTDGTFSAEKLADWINVVKEKCIGSGHWEVASSEIGQVLKYSPLDEAGLWVDPVCAVLDQDGHDRMRSGLTMEIFNSRGVYSPDGGKWETAAAENWEKIADSAENKGYALLAQELRRLATSYRHDAERDARGNFADLD